MTREEMLNECISRDRAIVQLNYLKSDWDDDLNVAIRKCIETIKKLPSVMAQPKMGHWFIDERPESDREVVCSNCDQSIFKYHKLDFDYRPKYCPNCGAKMSEIPTGQIVANGELYPGEFDDPLAEEGSDKE